jgi:hypothetical protein
MVFLQEGEGGPGHRVPYLYGASVWGTGDGRLQLRQQLFPLDLELLAGDQAVVEERFELAQALGTGGPDGGRSPSARPWGTGRTR